jgi:NADH dehydrogenase
VGTDGRVRSPRKVVILGAGYAGVMAANRLLSSLTEQEKGQVHVTIVNARERFVERIRLHELVAGTVDDVSMPLSEILHPDAHVLVGSAYLIEPERNVVQVNRTSGSLELDYDELVYAVGSSSAVQVPGALEHAYFMADPDRAAIAAQAIAAVPESGRVVVVGGGLTGIETASEIAEARPELNVTLLVGSDLAPGFGNGSRRAVERTLRKLGVEVVGSERVHSVRDGELVFDSGSTLSFDACVWAAGFEVPDLAAQSGLAVDPLGRLRVGEDLTSLDASNIVGAGDCVVLPVSNGAHLRMGCAVALPLGGHAAETVLHHLRGTRALPASVGFLVQCLSLGRKRGVIQFVRADDSPRALFLSGGIGTWFNVGAWFKEYICTLTVVGPRKERTRPGAYQAPKGPKSQQLRRA